MVCVSAPAAAGIGEGLADAGAAEGAADIGAGAAATAGSAVDLSGTAAALGGIGESAADAGAAADSAAALGGGALGAGGAGAAAANGGSYLDSLLSGIQAGASDSAPIDTSSIGGSSGFGAGANVGSYGTSTGLGIDGSPQALLSGSPSAGSTAGNIAANSSPSWLDQLGTGAAKNPLNAALAGGSVLSGVQSLIPRKQVNTAQNAANVLATNPSFSNPNLPQYTMQNTATPYSGDWYTYGQKPEAPLYNAQPIPVNNVNAAKKGGLMGYAHGGMIRKFAAGGPVSLMGSMLPSAPPPMGAPSPQMQPQGMPAPPPRPPMQQAAQRKPINPLAINMAAHKIGVAIGKHMKQRGMTPDGRVAGKGGGQDDIVPARLSKDEYVIPADVTSQLGDGSSEAGGKKLDAMLANVRKHKTGNTKYPAKAKNPLAYIPKGAK